MTNASPKVVVQYEAVRRSGLTNMLDMNQVQRIAYDNNFYDLVNFIEEDKKNYSGLLMSYGELIETINDEDIPEVNT